MNILRMGITEHVRTFERHTNEKPTEVGSLTNELGCKMIAFLGMDDNRHQASWEKQKRIKKGGSGASVNPPRNLCSIL